MKNFFEDRRVVIKIQKMDENNQYGNAMTEPLPAGSIKRVKKLPTMEEFDLILQGVLDTNKIGHLFIVDIDFCQKNVIEKQLSCNGNYTLTFEKKKVLSVNERSVFQLLDTTILNDKGKIDSYKTTSKTHTRQWTQKLSYLHKQNI